MAWNVAIPAIASVAGAMIANKGAKQRNREAQLASAKQMDFQERMSNTAYQRGMEDMRQAGLNPILASKVGGASTPTGSTYNPENTALAGVNAFTAVQQNLANVESTRATTAKTQAETKVIKDSGMSFMGRNIEYLKKEIQSAISNVTDNEKVTKALDKIMYNLKRARSEYEAKNNVTTGELGKMLRIPIYRGK